jgi:CubicO group peptidase (beta-lactamase class C family)
MDMGHRNLIRCLSIAALLLPGACQGAPLTAKDVQAIVRKGFERFAEPGISVVVVEDGKVVWEGGFGVRKVGEAAPVDADTIFALGSCSKSFASALAARLVDEKKIDWDDKVQRRLPWFSLYDPAVTRMVSLRDLLGMRTGLASSEYSYRRSSESRQQQVWRMRFLKPAVEFRDQYIYSTDNYTAIGVVESVVSGMPWEDLAQKELWGPLGMASTNASYVATSKSADFAYPHVRRDGKSVPIDLFYEEYSGLPAGGVNASARDLGVWLRFQLDGGVFEGRRLISAAALEETHTPQMVMRGRYGKDYLQEISGSPAPMLSHQTYDMGWTSREYHGVNIVSHNGAIDGFRCSMTLAPSAKLGIGLLTNSDDGMMNEAIAQQLLDKALAVSGPDWIDAFARYADKSARDRAAAAEASTPKRRPDQPPSRPLAAFAGSYEDIASGYGAATLTVVAGRLSMAAGRMTYAFEPWAGDVFRVTENSPSGADGDHPFFAKFDTDMNGDVAAIETTTGARFERRGAGAHGP